MLNMLSLIAWIIVILVMVYQTMLDFKTGLLDRRVTHVGIAATGIILAVMKSIVDSSFAPVVLSLITGITAYYFFKYTIYRTGLIGGGDVRVMYSLGFMFPSLADVPYLINNTYLFGVKETWPYLSLYFNLMIIGGFFVIFEILYDCYKGGLITSRNKNFKYFVGSITSFTGMVIFSASLTGIGRTLTILFSFILGLFLLKRFAMNIMRKKVKFQDLPALKHQTIPTQRIIEESGSIQVIDDVQIKKMKNDKKPFKVIAEKNTVIPTDILRSLALRAPETEIEIQAAKPRTVYLLIMVIMLPLGDLYTIINKIIMG
ncbi:MAG: prepilin peptidase [Candidatus Methanoperedens sp.]